MTVEPERQLTPTAGFGAEVREVLRMALPAIVATSSATLMGFVDFFMVSRLSVDAAAAISPSSILVFTIISFFMGVLSCTNTFVSQSFGRKDYVDCSRYAWQGLWGALIFGTAALALWPLAPHLFRALRHAPNLQPLETAFFQWRLPSMGPIVALSALVGFFQGISRPRVTMTAAIIANALNVLFNYMFIYGHWGAPALGVVGSALGTVFASCIQVALLMALFLSPGCAEKFGTRRHWRFDWARMARLWRVGTPAGLSWLLDVGTWGVFFAVIVGRLGEIPLAANNMAMQWLHISFMPTVGLGIAITALVGQAIGRRDFAEARRHARVGFLLGMAYMALMGVVYLLFRHELMLLFIKGDEKPELAADIVRVGSTLLIFAAAFQIFDAMGIVAGSALRGAGDTRFPMITTVVLGVAVFLPLCWLFTKTVRWGVNGAWIGGTIYILALGVVLVWRWRGRAWESIDIFKSKAAEGLEIPSRPTPYEPGDESST